MKKLTVWALLCALLLSFGGIAAAAELPANVSFTAGRYCVENGADFSPVGDIALTWDPDASAKLDLSDGDLSDWVAAGYECVTIDTSNVVSWVGETAPEGWSISSYYAIDADYLYAAFSVTDPTFTYASAATGYNGDAIQMSIDFGCKMGAQLEEDPDVLFGPKNVFYSFACVADGAPLEIQLQESDQDGMLTEANGDGVKGVASKTDTGWCAELALSLDMLFEQYVWKDWDEDGYIYVGSDDNIPFKLGVCLYYLDRSETGGSVNWAAGTTNGIVDDAGVPQLSWSPYDNGMRLILEYQEDLHFTTNGIKVIYTDSGLTETPCETEPPYAPDETEWTTEIAIEEDTLPPVWETMSPDVEETIRDAAESLDVEDELNAILEKYGCSAVMSMGSLTALLALAVAAVVGRKKK